MSCRRLVSCIEVNTFRFGTRKRSWVPTNPSNSVLETWTLADLWGVILRRTCNGKKALPLFQILFS